MKAKPFVFAKNSDTTRGELVIYETNNRPNSLMPVNYLIFGVGCQLKGYGGPGPQCVICPRGQLRARSVDFVSRCSSRSVLPTECAGNAINLCDELPAGSKPKDGVTAMRVNEQARVPDHHVRTQEKAKAGCDRLDKRSRKVVLFQRLKPDCIARPLSLTED